MLLIIISIIDIQVKSHFGYFLHLTVSKIEVKPPVRKRSTMHSMQRTSSSADISTYDGCGEASKKLQFIANFVFLTASLILIGTGKLVVDIQIHTQSYIYNHIMHCSYVIMYFQILD